MQNLESHPLGDHQNDHFARPVDCPDPLCLRHERDSTICFKCPEGHRESVGPPRSGWAGYESPDPGRSSAHRKVR